jgi:hypothetical protein
MRKIHAIFLQYQLFFVATKPTKHDKNLGPHPGHQRIIPTNSFLRRHFYTPERGPNCL